MRASNSKHLFQKLREAVGFSLKLEHLRADWIYDSTANLELSTTEDPASIFHMCTRNKTRAPQIISHESMVVISLKILVFVAFPQCVGF